MICLHRDSKKESWEFGGGVQNLGFGEGLGLRLLGLGFGASWRPMGLGNYI